jgi:hypothetical protein
MEEEDNMKKGGKRKQQKGSLMKGRGQEKN